MFILEFIGNQILTQASVLFGLIAFVGLALKRRPVEEIVLGVVKTIMGYEIIMVGADVLTKVVTPISSWISHIIGVNGMQISMWTMLSVSMAENGTAIGIAMLIGFAINLIAARVTPLKTVNVTGHIMLLISGWIVALLVGFGFSGTSLIIVASILCAIHYWIAPSIMYYFMKDKITNEYSLCMPSAVFVALTCWISKKIGNEKENCDNIKVPDSLMWVRDSVVSIAVFGTIFWLIIGLLAGKDIVTQTSGDQNWIIFLIILGIKFAGGVAIILQGVRMLLQEIVPAFRGIADKFIPGAILALDYPTVFSFSPIAVFIGFFSKLLGAVVGTFLQVAMGFSVIILPSVFMDFWDGALLGVFADKWGGRRAALIVPFILGILIQLSWSLAFPYTGSFLTGNALALDYADTGVIGLILGNILKLFN